MDIRFDGELTCRPITLEDLARDNVCLRAMYQFRKTVDDPLLQQQFDTVLRMASDQLCSLCCELNVDPNILDQTTGSRATTISSPRSTRMLRTENDRLAFENSVALAADP